MKNPKYKYEFEILDRTVLMAIGETKKIGDDIVKVKRYKNIHTRCYQILYIQINDYPETFLERGFRTEKSANSKFKTNFRQDFKRFVMDNYCQAYPQGIKKYENYGGNI